MSNRQLFGTDGIRGPAGQYPLDQTGALQVGKAIGSYFATPGEYIVVGCDTRESSPKLKSAVVAGVTAVGVNVQDVDVIPTPGVAYLTKHTAAKAGVMITASHNPYRDNGIKLFSNTGGKLPDNTEATLNQLIDSKLAEQAKGVISQEENPAHDYIEFLIGSAGFGAFEGLRLAIDCANGATSTVAQEVFESLGAEVTMLFDQPNGRNINAGCGATDPVALAAAVKAQGLDGGIAFDGDGDRVLLVDAKGRLLTGDHILYVIALGRHISTVVGTTMSNIGLETALKSHDIDLLRTDVGDRYVLEELEKTGLKLGGEQSGHIILTDYLPTGDGLLAAIQTLRYVIKSGKNLAAWYDKLPLQPQALVNIPLADKSLLSRAEIKDFVAKQSAELAGKGRLNIRPSGTEPKLRVMVEAPEARQKAEHIAGELKELLGKL